MCGESIDMKLLMTHANVCTVLFRFLAMHALHPMGGCLLIFCPWPMLNGHICRDYKRHSRNTIALVAHGGAVRAINHLPNSRVRAFSFVGNGRVQYNG